MSRPATGLGMLYRPSPAPTPEWLSQELAEGGLGLVEGTGRKSRLVAPAEQAGCSR
jgi:hypothetical protein